MIAAPGTRTRRHRPLAMLAVAAAFGPAAAAGGSIAVRGETLYTSAGPPIEDGVVVIEDGTIVRVGPSATISIPEGTRVVSAKVVTPGLVDAHTVVGLAGYLNQAHDQDQLESSAPIQPELRAIDAYNARERLIRWLGGFGVTTIHTGHAPGALISGQTMIAKTAGETVDEATVVATAMLAATLGGAALTDAPSGTAPGTRSKAVALLRSELTRAQEYRRKRAAADSAARPARDLRLEVLVDVLERRMPLLVTANRHHDILSALRVAQEFDVRVVLDGAAEAYLLIDEIRRAGVPVIVHPTMQRAVGETENLSMETAALLADAGIPIALQSGYESYVPKTRVVLFEAALAASHRLGAERALGAVTSGAARLLGIGDRVGTLEPGKDGDLAMFDGDPFEYTSHCVGTVIDGRLVYPGER